jgi:ELWxxDGT repeat protein
VTTGAVLEFDLGRFLGWAGNPDAVGSAQLVLHAPQTTAPIQAPVNIGSILAVGDLVFFSAATPGEGQELWVTEGSEETTRFVMDLNPGADGSFPANFVNVGGKLYFTANGGVAGTQLWKSDGTALGTQKVADIPGFAANLTALSGSAVLTAAQAGPSDGIPAVDYSFTLEILRADGSMIRAGNRRRSPRTAHLPNAAASRRSATSGRN